MTEKQIEELFVRYGATISEGDLPGIAGCYATPALVLTGETTLLVQDAAAVEAAFADAVRAYRAQGLVGALPRIEAIQPLSNEIALVAVSWEHLDADDRSLAGGSFRYLVRHGAHLGICVVVSTP